MLDPRFTIPTARSEDKLTLILAANMEKCLYNIAYLN